MVWSSQLLAFAPSLLPLLIVSTLILVLELALPLAARAHGARRVRVNLSLWFLTLGFNFLLNLVLAFVLIETQLRGWGVLPFFASWVDLVFVIVVLDFATWVAHWAMHNVPFLWRLHLVHHVDELVDVTTSFRQHPGEGLWRFSVIACVAVALGASLEMLVIYRALSALNALFEHGNFRTSDGLDRWIGWFWVTPNLHKKHHSSLQTETDTNYGNLLSVFDRLFGTFTSPLGAARIVYGIEAFPNARAMTLRALLRLPFGHKKSRPQ